MGNVTIFAKAFRECGIGGRFSKFHIAQTQDWFELINVDKLEDSRYCFKVYDRFDYRKFRCVAGGDAIMLHRYDPQWVAHFQTAQKVIAKIVSRDNNRGENRYYVDDFHESVYVVNRMFVIEVTPVLRQVPEVSSSAVYEFLEVFTKDRVTADCEVKVYSRFGKVVVGCNQRLLNSLLTPEDFNEQYGAAV